MADIDLRTALTAEECRARLRRAAEADEWESSDQETAIVLALDGDRITVADASDSGAPRMLRRLLAASILDEPGGARVRGRFALAMSARLALTVWFFSMAVVALLLGLARAAAPDGLTDGVPAWLVVATPLAMIGLAAVVVRWSLAQSADRERAMVEYLARLLR